MTALITISFMMRNTSCVGWIPLLAIKVLFSRSFIPFLKAGILVALPTILLCIYIDTLYYGSEQLVLTSYNFLKVNLLKGLSSYFGESGENQYFFVYSPIIFTLLYPVVAYSWFWSHMKRKIERGQKPFLALFCGVYLTFFSYVKHKELRFLLPIVPFSLLMAGETIWLALRHSNKRPLIRKLLQLWLLVDSVWLYIETQIHQHYSMPAEYLSAKG